MLASRQCGEMTGSPPGILFQTVHDSLFYYDHSSRKQTRVTSDEMYDDQSCSRSSPGVGGLRCYGADQKVGSRQLRSAVLSVVSLNTRARSIRARFSNSEDCQSSWRRDSFQCPQRRGNPREALRPSGFDWNERV